MSGYGYTGGFWWSRRFNPHKIWLESAFRVFIIKRGIDKAGSINRLGRELGYRSRVHPGWNIRQILIGERPFTMERLEKLANYLEYPVSEMLKYNIERERITVRSTEMALKENGIFYYLLR